MQHPRGAGRQIPARERRHQPPLRRRAGESQLPLIEAATDPAATAIQAGEFAALMAALGPFEREPVVAAAVSGGADSMALCLLAHPWARRRSGRLVALTVDHGLRPGARAEAARVGQWLAQRGIAHRVLRWQGEKPRRGVQAAAREARYRLLREWCARHGTLHLLLAHQLEDQAETVLMRLARGSGVEGLAAMGPLGADRGVLLLRPLLGTPKARLVATLRRAKQPWIEDPSNRDPAFQRVRVRSAGAALQAAGVSAPRLARTARHMARARIALEADTTDLLARAARIDPAGFCLVDPQALAAAADEISLRALSRVLMCVSGADYPARFERLARLAAAIAAGLDSARTLSGCRIAPWGDRLLVCREAAAAAGPAPLSATTPRRLWDGRFLVWLSAARKPGSGRGLAVARLGQEGWRQVVAAQPEARASRLPPAVRTLVPALWRAGPTPPCPRAAPRIVENPLQRPFRAAVSAHLGYGYGCHPPFVAYVIAGAAAREFRVRWAGRRATRVSGMPRSHHG